MSETNEMTRAELAEKLLKYVSYADLHGQKELIDLLFITAKELKLTPNTKVIYNVEKKKPNDAPSIDDFWENK